MKRKTCSKKKFAIIVMAVMLIALTVTGCGNASADKGQETIADSAQNSGAESKEETGQAESAATEEPVPTQEPTPEPTPKIELPEIDERYEYHLYCYDSHRSATPLIGLNTPEGYEALASEMSREDDKGEYNYLTDMQFYNSKYSIRVGEEISLAIISPLETNEQAIPPQIVQELEEKAVVDTAFGEAYIYWETIAYQFDDPSEYHYVQEIDGKKYVVVCQEVAVLSIDSEETTHQIFFTCERSANSEYEGIIEGVISQILEPK